MKFPRNITKNFVDAISDTPVVLLNGARQTGKSTFVKALKGKGLVSNYITMDDPTIYGSSVFSPLTFIEKLPHGTIIDEVQRVPEIFPVIKKVVDEDRRPGRFVLTGSANIMLLPKISESLAGRVEICTLYPLSQGEIRGKKEGFIDAVFNDTQLYFKSDEPEDLTASLINGGYPEVLNRKDVDRKNAWFQSYITTILQRDVRDIANIDQLGSLPNLLSIIATRSGGIQNFSDLSRDSKLAQSTLKRYMVLLEALYLIYHLPAWYNNLGKRLIKSPKDYISDTGLLLYLLGRNPNQVDLDSRLSGVLIENFVINELQKQKDWSKYKPKLYHYRTIAGQEVDIVMELPSGEIVAIEIKSSSKISPEYWKQLKELKQAIGKKFCNGIILYTGNQTIQLDDKLWALPISSLWQLNSEVAVNIFD